MVETLVPQSEVLTAGSWYPPSLSEKTHALVAATDGTAAGDAAVHIASLIGAKTSAAVNVLTVGERHGRPAVEIVECAARNAAQMIVIGQVGHGMLDRILDRETALELVRRSSIPTLLVSPNLRSLPKRALLAIDFSPESMEAARHSSKLLDDEAFVILAHVAPSASVFAGSGLSEDEYETLMERELRKVAGRLSFPAGIRMEHVILHGRPAHSLLKLAGRTHADLISVGTRGAGHTQRLFVGSNTARVIHNSTCSVLIAPCRERNGTNDTPK